jgi:glycine hydroxymethyltransferase
MIGAKINDPEIQHFLSLEAKRQKTGLEMIPSENYVSDDVLKAMGSILTNKYSEGYPHKRYYGGNEYIDEIELLAINRAKALFGVEHVNVQPYSGSPANLAVYMATCKPGDTIMGLNLPDGGHLTHGWKVSFTGIFFKSIPYHVNHEGRVDFEEVERLARKYRPKLIWTGATAYVYQYEFSRFSKVADEIGAYFVADIAHTAGLVIAGVHENPVPYAHLVTSTTHKTLRGPRGGMIMVTKKGLKKDPELAEKVDRAVFPGLQGGPHDHITAAKAVAFREAATQEFKVYGRQIVKNAKALGKALIKKGFTLVGNGTENHLLLVDLQSHFGAGGGFFAQYALDLAGITLNKNTIPFDPSSPFYPSGIRLGTPALTTRGMKEKEMATIAEYISVVLEDIRDTKLPESKEERKTYLAAFRSRIQKNKLTKEIRQAVKEFAQVYPIFTWD